MDMPSQTPGEEVGLLEAIRNNETWMKRILFALAVVVRCVLFMHPHSGEATPPMYGDYEAQRHWMEITTQIPLKQWYSYDLQYWGLDYPPVTAYHSYAIGLVGRHLLPEAFALDTSRGHESYEAKVFMRTSVLVSDLLLYMPAAWYAVHSVASRGNRFGAAERFDALALLWLHPGLLLIDYGHFQFNGVCLGFALLAVGCVARHKYLWASVAYTLSFLFKQIALYYAPGFFFTILYLCLADVDEASHGVGERPRLVSLRGTVNVLTTGLVVAATVAAVFSPWIVEQDWDGVVQVLHRMFPFARGLYEDKVANVWCSLSLVFKMDRFFARDVVLKIATGCTVATLLPACAAVMTRRKYGSGGVVAALVASAASFYLFSFQVHEKSILFPVVMAVLLPTACPSTFAHQSVKGVVIVTFVSLFSMYPLVVKDGLYVLYFALLLMMSIVCEQTCCQHDARWRHLWHTVLGICISLHIVHATVTPPERYPDLVTMLFTCFSCLCFSVGAVALTVGQIYNSYDCNVKKVE
eukprot:TRINITY_DN18223_c0_g1_i1.p1 TRINITY_DN18223_c0_g1~~TRINITY_DN18223_c0_g1_i1.p1  ORF type:complete len:539 (+),score=208.93 TRINITY_DN18223_c0_g1_i1:47-1618(+)